jgi:hypothetical protein
MTDTIPTTKTLPGISPAGRGAFSNAVAWTLADLAGRTNPLGLPAAAPRFLPLFLLVPGVWEVPPLAPGKGDGPGRLPPA